MSSFTQWLFLLGGAMALLADGQTAPVAPASAPLKVVSFSTITTEIVQKVGGNEVAVTGLVGPGVDPHEYEPTPEDLKTVAGADMIVGTGKGMEGYLSKLRESAPKAVFVDAGGTIPALQTNEGGLEVDDPHWWQSVGNIQLATITVRDALARLRPSATEAFFKNEATYQRDLQTLDKWVRAKVAELPMEQRKLVTSHDAFQYFARDYVFIVYPVEGVSTDDEPSSQKVAALIKTIGKQKVKAVFFENIENPKVVQEITDETGARICGKLYADGLGATEAKSIDEMYKHNVTLMVDSLK